MSQLSRRLGLMFARIALSAWVGAATLFVINGVRLVTTNAFDSVGRDHVALIRFPAYYFVGAVLMAVSVAGIVAARGLPGLTKRRWGVVVSLSLLASVVMLGDYMWVYLPLAEMITPPGRARPQGFTEAHEMSKYVNALQVAMCLVAAMIANWPMQVEMPGVSNDKQRAPSSDA